MPPSDNDQRDRSPSVTLGHPHDDVREVTVTRSHKERSRSLSLVIGQVTELVTVTDAESADGSIGYEDGNTGTDVEPKSSPISNPGQATPDYRTRIIAAIGDYYARQRHRNRQR